MNAGASINSKAPCHLYFSRLAGGERYVEASPEGLPFTSCLIFRRESTPRRHSRNLQSGIQRLLNTYGPRLKNCRGDEQGAIEAFRGDDLFFCHSRNL